MSHCRILLFSVWVFEHTADGTCCPKPPVLSHLSNFLMTCCPTQLSFVKSTLAQILMTQTWSSLLISLEVALDSLVTICCIHLSNCFSRPLVDMSREVVSSPEDVKRLKCLYFQHNVQLCFLFSAVHTVRPNNTVITSHPLKNQTDSSLDYRHLSGFICTSRCNKT